MQGFRRGRLNHTAAEEADTSPHVVTGTILVHSIPTLAPFDSGATHSFISKIFATQQELETTSLENFMLVHSLGSILKTKLRCFDVRVVINGVGFNVNLIMIDTPGLDVILGMEWLAKYQGVIDCAKRAVSLVNSDGDRILFTSTYAAPSQQPKLNSISIPELSQVPVVCEYPNVFLDKLLGMPSDWDIEFVIDLIPKIAPVSK